MATLLRLALRTPSLPTRVEKPFTVSALTFP
jgi:hypothetical protein